MRRPPIESIDDLPRLPPAHALIDSHCHLDMESFERDLEPVLQRARDAGVTAMIAIGASGPLEANEAAVRLARQHDHIFATVGVHPHEAKMVDEPVVERLRALASDEGVVGIGESGLDYHYDHSPRQEQRRAFRRFAELAAELELPLVVHLRNADEDAAEILRESGGGVGGVIHCFSGDAASARVFLDLGYHISFSGILTFKSADDLRAAAAIVPDDRLLVETDSPFLAPTPFRGRRNEPALVVRTAAVLAEVRGTSIEAVADCTRENTRHLFGLPEL